MVDASRRAGLFMTIDAVAEAGDKIRCDACPVMCYIKPGAAGACDRYANNNGELVRVDPHIVLERTVSHGGRLVPFQAGGGDWDGKLVREPNVFVTAIGAGTTYPDYLIPSNSRRCLHIRKPLELPRLKRWQGAKQWLPLA